MTLRVCSITCAAVLAGFLTSLATEPALAKQSGSAAIGFVYDYVGAPESYTIVRAKHRVPVAPIQPLLAGDRVSVSESGVKAAKSRITISVAGQLYAVGAGRSPFCVGARGGVCGAPNVTVPGPLVASLTVLKNIVSSLTATRLRTAKQDYDKAPTTSLASRGGAGTKPPSIPILQSSPKAWAPAGSATLVVPISGGTSPLRASLISPAGQQLAELSNITGAEARFQTPQLATAKNYRIEISDATFTGTGAFDVVAIPAPDRAIQVAMEPGQPLRDIIIAAYAQSLIRKGPQWYLAAYQLLQTASPQNPRVRELLFLLREGPV